MFEYTNGFKKAMYWSKAKMEAHAIKYSPGFAADKRKGTAFTFWSKDFDGMAYKTLLRQLISKWGIMSIDMISAFDSDYAVINEDGTKNYVETESDVIEMEMPEVQEEKTESSENTTDAAAALFGE
jgi:recombination protein RecT